MDVSGMRINQEKNCVVSTNQAVLLGFTFQQL